jgi:hypothetical protein
MFIINQAPQKQKYLINLWKRVRTLIKTQLSVYTETIIKLEVPIIEIIAEWAMNKDPKSTI